MSKEQTPVELFDGLGKFRPRAEFSDQELMALGDAREPFEELHAALANEVSREQDVKDVFAAIKQAAARVEIAKNALYKFRPRLSALDCWKRDVAGVVPQTVFTEEQQALVNAAERELGEAEENLTICQSELGVAQQAVKTARARVAMAFNAFKSRFIPMTQTQAFKDHLNRTKVREQAVADGIIEATVHQGRVFRSQLDAQLSGGRAAPGQRYNQARRGAHERSNYGRTVVKTPSEK